jgi:hypothetical protein
MTVAIWKTRYLLSMACAGAAMATTATAAVTYSKDVAPILQRRCVECHRPGEIGPFPMLTYEQTRPWAASIKESLLAKKMPPWFADPHYGKFSNDRSLSRSEIETVVAWVNSGALEGDPKDLHAQAEFVEGWGIPRPDVVFQLPEPYRIPATGTIEYLHFLLPSGFKTDQWVQFAEARPTDRSRVHHIIAYVREPGSQWLKDIKPGVPYIEVKRKADENADTSALPSDFLVGYAPGQPPESFEPGQAKLVKAGSDIILQVHYTTNGKPGTDQSRVGLVFAKEPPARRVMTFSASNGKFRIPAGDPNYQVDAEFELGTDVTLHGLHPHMHFRGKDFLYRVKFPSGETQTLLSVPAFTSAWQLWYNLETPLQLPKGSIIQCTAHFDNSANNPLNPDPTKDVTWGDQSWDEMMVGFFNLVFDARMPEKNVFGPSREPKSKTK